MHPRQIRRARVARKLGIGLMVLALLPIAWFIAASLHPAVPALPAPALPGADALPLQRLAWIPHPLGLLCALASLSLMWLGAIIAARQKTVFDAAKRETEDRLRRVREYGTDGRIEPYIGAPMTFDQDREPG